MVPKNVLHYKTATIPIFVLIKDVYKSCVNNPYILVGLVYPWHMLFNQII